MVVKHNLLKQMSDQDNEVLEATISNEELELDTELGDTEDVEMLREQIERQKIANQQILARAKKAEAENKSLKGAKSDQSTQTTINNLSSEDIEVTILKAQKVSEDEITYLKKLAKLNGTSIIEAQSDEIFTAFKAKKEATEKSERAKLGASRGSGSIKKEKEINTPGLTDQDHKDLWRQRNG